VRRVLPDLLNLGRYRHPWLGIRFAYRLAPDFARRLNLPISEGLLIVELYHDSPLAAQEIRGAQQEVILGNQRLFIGGDIITAVEGVKVTSLEELEILLETTYQVGDTVEVTVLRDGQAQTLEVELAEEPIR
jgi:S1-C subfamily serine protease